MNTLRGLGGETQKHGSGLFRNSMGGSPRDRKRWFIQDRVVAALRDSFRAHGVEATERQIERVAKDIAADWDRLLD